MLRGSGQAQEEGILGARASELERLLAAIEGPDSLTSRGPGAWNRGAPPVFAKSRRLRERGIRGWRGGVGVVDGVLDGVDGYYMADHDGNIFSLRS